MGGDIVGRGFRPTDEELVDYYLKHKLLGDEHLAHIIPVIDLCNVEPWEVPVILAKQSAKVRFGDPDWFFFSPVSFKYSKSKRLNRTTKSGFWKATGKDRDIRRTWDTNTRIATKKTLVYYKGKVSDGVKFNFVIHEYHAVTFPETQRTFVLCCLKGHGKTTEGGTDALICDEGESSRSIPSDYENQATIETEGIPSGGTFTGMETIQQPPTGIEEEGTSFPTYPSNSAYFGNEDNIMEIPFETTKEEEYLNYLIAGESMFTSEESEHAFVNSSIQSESLERVYDKIIYESMFTNKESEHAFINSSIQSKSLGRVYDEIIYESMFTNEESEHAFVNNSTQSESLGRVYDVISNQDDNIVDILRQYENPNSEEYYSSKRFKSSHDVHDGICCPNHEEYQEKNESMLQDNFWGADTSSSDSSLDKPLEMNNFDISSSPFTPWK